MLTPVRSSQFRRDLKRLAKQGKNLGKLRALPERLVREEPRSALHRDHALRGPWNGYREAHIEGDWLLIYRVEGHDLLLARSGSHSELFE